MHHYILNQRALYGLPRKFNVAFDGAGLIAVLEDTNDIGFQAVEVKNGLAAGRLVPLALGGITGHGDFARDTGLILKPAGATGSLTPSCAYSPSTATAPTAKRRA